MEQCEQFLRAEHPLLLRAAFLLTGDRTTAQDLAQETAVREVMQWRKVQRADSPRAYSRAILMNVFLGGRRRAWTGEVPHHEPPDGPATAADFDAVENRALLREHLLALPARQRAAVVLRFYEDMSEVMAAQALGCSVGNVKSLTSRGLTQLRVALRNEDDPSALERKAQR